MKYLIFICTILVLHENAFSQSDSTKLSLGDTSLFFISTIGNCYFEHKEYRANGSLKKVVRHDGNGLSMIITYNRKGKRIRTKLKKGPIMSQAPPCYNAD